jgi:hypothetical protein
MGWREKSKQEEELVERSLGGMERGGMEAWSYFRGAKSSSRL